MDIILKAAPEKLIEKAEAIRNLQNEIDHTILQLQILIESSVNYWNGEAGDQFRDAACEIENKREEAKQRFSQAADKLIEISEIYRNTENSAGETVAVLNNMQIL